MLGLHSYIYFLVVSQTNAQPPGFILGFHTYPDELFEVRMHSSQGYPRLPESELNVGQLDFPVRVLIVSNYLKDDEQLIRWEFLLSNTCDNLRHLHSFALLNLF